jgi:hypothetical protein
MKTVSTCFRAMALLLAALSLSCCCVLPPPPLISIHRHGCYYDGPYFDDCYFGRPYYGDCYGDYYY